MTSLQAVDRVLAWARGVIPEITTAYNWPTQTNPQRLPDIAVAISSYGSGRSLGSRAGVPASSALTRTLQQQRSDVWAVQLSILNAPEPQQARAHEVWEWTDRLLTSWRADHTLGGRFLETTAPEFSFDPAWETPAGSRGHLMLVDLGLIAPMV